MSTAASYLDKRLKDQANWHSKKASSYQKRFYLIEVITLVAGALIPVVNVFTDPRLQRYQRIASAVLAASIVVATGISKLYKFQENWLTYRGLEEELKREEQLFLNKVGQYGEGDEEKRQQLLVERTETILSTTTSRFISLHRAEREKPQEAEKR
ncbi:MAG: DUF4231 domain-containing protein [Acidobacteria bacterium]|nr:DUF4231 domain-containing protein [Acidobacteriota bacterium]